MRITKIELAGSPLWNSENTANPGMPRAFATISRRVGDNSLTVEVITAPDKDNKIATPRTHTVNRGDRDDMWSMADCLHKTLEGYKGTNGDVQDYMRALEIM